MQNANEQFSRVEEKLGFLSKFLNPVMKVLGDREFFNLPLKLFYYIIAFANLLLPLAVLFGGGFIMFTGWIYLNWWAMLLLPIFFIIILIISVIIGVGCYTLWVRRLNDIVEYNRNAHTYMAIRNFGLFIRTLGEWVGLILIFIGVIDILSIPIPYEILALVDDAETIPETITEAIILFFAGYLIIFISKAINDWTQGFAAKADDMRDIADIERAKAEIESQN